MLVIRFGTTLVATQYRLSPSTNRLTYDVLPLLSVLYVRLATAKLPQLMFIAPFDHDDCVSSTIVNMPYTYVTPVNQSGSNGSAPAAASAASASAAVSGARAPMVVGTAKKRRVYRYR